MTRSATAISTRLAAASLVLFAVACANITPRRPKNEDTVCTNTCQFARNGICEDGSPGALYDDCKVGTDCDDCGGGSGGVGGTGNAGGVGGTGGIDIFLCEDYCEFFSDGVCDDGGPGAVTFACDFGSDCSDCGPR